MEEIIIDVCRRALLSTILVSAPAVVAALAVGLIVSIFQTATQIQEQTLGYVPKLLAVVGALVVFGPWMLGELVRLTASILEQVALVSTW